MSHSSAVGFLVCVLCLLACVSTSATGVSSEGGKAAAHIVEVAKQEVEAAKTSTNQACGKAQSNIDNARLVLEKVERYKKETEEARSKAQEMAQENKDAGVIVEKIKTISNSVSTLHQGAKEKLEQTIASLGEFMKEAERVKSQCNTELLLIMKYLEDYKDTDNKVPDIKHQAGELENKITEILTKMNGVQSTADNMEGRLKEAQLANFHVSVIVAVAEIQTMISEADNNIKETETKKGEVTQIVQEMQTLKTTATGEAIENVNRLYETAEGELTTATGAVDNAKEAYNELSKEKAIADAALTKIQTEQVLSEAQKDVTKAQGCVEKVKQIGDQLRSVLQTARNSVTQTNALKQEMEKALPTTNSEPGTEQSVTNPEVKALQRSASAAVDAIQTMMGEAGSTLQETEKHKQTVYAIVQEMKALKTTAKSESNEGINELCMTTEGELTKATRAVETVKTEKEAMRQQKILADAALREVNTATEIDMAQPQVDKATSCLDEVKKSLDQVQSALQTATNSVAKANDLRRKLKTALSTTTTALSTKEVKETKKSGLTVENGTEPDQQDTTIQPTITDTEQLASKKLPSQSDNRSEKIKDTLSTGAQNVPTTALTREKTPAPGANNDSAMTVSVPLLVALIASAVLQ